MKIAVLGGGFCGMAVAWNLLQIPGINVVIFDPKGIAKGTSSIAAGLLHPYVGVHSKLNWRAIEGVAATKKLIHIAEQALGKIIAYPQGMLRIASSPSQLEDFRQCVHKYDDVFWKTEAECQKTISQIPPKAGIFIGSAITVDCESYLKGLWQACKARKALFEQTAIKTLKELDAFDGIVIAMGANTLELPEASHLTIHNTKGQILEFLWPDNLTRLPFPINSQAYLLMSPGQSGCIAGATYENQFLGYGSLLRVSEYPYFREKNIPDVSAIWIDEPFRRHGLGKKLIEHLQGIARHEGYKTIGIGVGLYKDYGPAQKLYFKMGYQPDGNGITYKGNWVVPGAQHPVDDDLLIWLSKPLVT